MAKLPPLTQIPIQHVDRTPDGNYPLRILQAYRQHAGCNWVHEGEGPVPEVVLIMDQHNRQRAAILDAAIKVLVAAEDKLTQVAYEACYTRRQDGRGE